MDKLSSQGNIILQSYSDNVDKLVFKKIDLADELFIINDALNNKEYSKVVKYDKIHGKIIRLLGQTLLNSLINECRNVKNITEV